MDSLVLENKINELHKELRNKDMYVLELEKKISKQNLKLQYLDKVMDEVNTALLADRRKKITLSGVVKYAQHVHNILHKRSPSLRYASKEFRNFILHCQTLSPRPVFPPCEKQEVDISIIIPVYNQWQLTASCLNSILETCGNNSKIQYELILADDHSSDETLNAAQIYPGLKVTRTPQNVGFLRNCNYAVKQARGKAILLLNNDTIVLPNWMSSLHQTLLQNDNAVIVGSKVLYPNGLIQEAGCGIYSNGRAFQIGFQYPRGTPLLNIIRQTHYVSGCSMLIRKSFWEEVGGFDERYKEAYYEDSDLAMSAHTLGKKVLYQPLSELIHFEHRSYGLRSKILSYNRNVFVNKWSELLFNLNG